MTRKILSLGIVLLYLTLMTAHSLGQGAPDVINWSNPGSITVQRNTSVAPSQNTSNFLPNLDCQLITYRYVSSSDMNSGCFTEMAFGMMDADTNTVIFNDTDEGIKIGPYSVSDGLIPWPQSSDVISLTAVNTGGTYAAIYKNPFLYAQDQRNYLGQLTSKKLTQPADFALRDNLGNRIILNPQTIGYSPGGGWLVAETLTGSFIRVNLATLDVIPFTKSYGATGNPALLKTSLSITDDGRFAALSNNAASEFKVFDLSTCAGTISGTKPINCSSYDYFPAIQKQTGPIKYINRVRFAMDDLLAFDVTATDDLKSGSWLISPTYSITFKTNYLAFGDSYTSGEGAFDYLLGTDTDQNMCHLSKKSYPNLLINDLFGQRGGNSVACSGAVIRDVSSQAETYRGQVSGVLDFKSLKSNQPSLLETVMANHLPGYIAQQRFLAQDRPRILTVSIGGNDIGFGDLLRNCVSPHLRPGDTNNICYSTFEDQLEIEQLIKRTETSWVSLFKQLKNQSPGTAVYAIGYPSVSNPEGRCALNVHLSKSELMFAEATLSYLNDTIQRAATSSDIEYVDISGALVGHRFCEAVASQTAMNGLTSGKDAGVLGVKFFGKESYHPNALGHRLIEAAILKQTNNFASKPPISNPPTRSIATGIKTNRPVNKVAPSKNLTSVVAKKGSKVTVRSSTSGALKPSSKYTVRIGGSSGPIIGEAATDDEGVLSGEVVLPENITGGQSIHIVGPDNLDQSTDITQPIYIPTTDNDADGDGISDDLDTCPGAVNSSVDDNHDGVDDVCTSISVAPSEPGSTSSTTPASNSQDSPPNVGIASSASLTLNKPAGSSKLPTNGSKTSGSKPAKPDGNSPSGPVYGTGEVLSDNAKWQFLPILNWKKFILIVDLIVVLVWIILRIFNKYRPELSH